MKTNKMPEFYMIVARKSPNLTSYLPEKCFPDLGGRMRGGGTRGPAAPPPSHTHVAAAVKRVKTVAMESRDYLCNGSFASLNDDDE